MRLNSEDQDAVIHPGDILIGDINGVVCLPQSLAEKALDLIQSQVDGRLRIEESLVPMEMDSRHMHTIANAFTADQKVAEDIGKGRTVAEAMKEHRAHVKQP